MKDIKVGDVVRWNRGKMWYPGRVEAILDEGALVRIYDGSNEHDVIPLSELKLIPPIILDKKAYRSLVRLESMPSAALAGGVPFCIQNIDNIPLVAADFMAALERMMDEHIDESEILNWIVFMGEEIEKTLATSKGSTVYSDIDIISLAYNSIEMAFLDEEKNDFGRMLAITHNLLSDFIEDRKKPIEKRRYPHSIKVALLDSFRTDDVINTASDEEIMLYRLFAEELATEGNRFALYAVGYGCYGGNRAFPCDWERSRDALTRLYVIEKDMPSKAEIANTLGYIYYYGRCTNGIPEYEEAYKYFSFAAFAGVYEARYKIADMYKNGYGVVKSYALYEKIIEELYFENIEYIEDGIFDSKFADIALRVGDIALNQCGDEISDNVVARHFYKQAEFAIRMRTLEGDFYGDDKVRETINERLDETAERLLSCGYNPEKRSISYPSPLHFLERELSDGKRLDLVIKETGELVYKLTFSPHKREGDEGDRRMFITSAPIDMCGLYDELTLTYNAEERIPDEYIGGVVVIDEISERFFLYDGAPLFSAEGKYTLKKSIGKKDLKEYRFLSVVCGNRGRYNYLSDDESISVGDSVIVDLMGAECEAVVVNIFKKKESEMSFPLKKYKKILRKA